MDLGSFFLLIFLLGQVVIALIMLGSALSWPENKLDYKNLFFLLGSWLVLLGMIVAAIGIVPRTFSLQAGYLNSIYGLVLALVAVIATASNRPKGVWNGIGLFCMLVPIGIFLLTFV